MDSTNLSDRLAKLQARVEGVTSELCEFIMFIDAGLWNMTILTQSFKLLSTSSESLDGAIVSLESVAFADDFPQKIQDLNKKVESTSSNLGSGGLDMPKIIDKHYLN